MAPPAIFTSFSAGHDHAFALQKYLLLDTQHQEIRQHVEDIRTTLRPTSAISSTSSTASSPAVSPTRPRHSSTGFESSRRACVFEAREDSRRSRSQSRGALGTDTLCRLAEEERRLYDVNEGIKRALTELLNCDVARSDAAFRTWVQRRLMDAEKELRLERRRRSGP